MCMCECVCGSVHVQKAQKVQGWQQYVGMYALMYMFMCLCVLKVRKKRNETKQIKNARKKWAIINEKVRMWWNKRENRWIYKNGGKKKIVEKR